MLKQGQKTEIRRLLQEGRSHREIARVVHCSPATVDNCARQLEKGESEIGQLKQELSAELENAVETICYYIDQRLTAKGI